MRSIRSLCVAVVAIALLCPISAMAAKKYQVTGTVVEVNDKLIVVQKPDNEKWEIERTADTKVDGTLKKGARVTIHYTMSASDVEVK